jgi:serine/threonine-protein kinase RsbW
MITPDSESESRFDLHDQAGAIQLDIPASLRYLNIPAAVLHALAERMPDGPPEAAVSELELALQEACVNSVRHALEGQKNETLSLRFLFQPSQIDIAVEDNGSRFEAEEVALPDLDSPQEGGYGLFLIEQLVDTLSYQREGDTNRWLLTKRWKA